MVNPSTTTSATLRHPAHDRGLTLLELLIALAVVLAIGALALPYTFREFERRESVTLRDELLMQALMARARARSEGVPYAMVIDETGTLIKVIDLDPRDPGGVALESESFQDDAREDAQEATPREPWMVVSLPEGTQLLAPIAAGDIEPDPFAFADPLQEDVFQEEPQGLAGLRLAIFLPDGTLLGGRECILSGPAGGFRVEFDAWTARLHFSPLLDVSEPEA